MWIQIANRCTKFYAKRLSLSENIVESRRGATFLTHPVRRPNPGRNMANKYCVSCKLSKSKKTNETDPPDSVRRPPSQAP